MLKFKKINSKKELVNILRERSINYQYISFINSKGNQDYVYMVKHDDVFYSENVVGGFISYNKDKKMSRKDIEENKKDMGLYEPFNDGVLYELDVYPIFKDFVEYPITNVEFLNEEDLLIRVCKAEIKSFYDNLIK